MQALMDMLNVDKLIQKYANETIITTIPQTKHTNNILAAKMIPPQTL